MTTEIPLRLLPLRATIKRYNKVTGEYDQTIYSKLPGRIAQHRGYVGVQPDHISTQTEITLFICNYTFNGNAVLLKYEDRIEISLHVYRVLKVFDAESAQHHIEAEVEQLKTMGTSTN